MTDDEYLGHKEVVKWAIDALRTNVVRFVSNDGKQYKVTVRGIIQEYGDNYHADSGTPAGDRLNTARYLGLSYLRDNPVAIVKAAEVDEQYFDALKEGLAILLETGNAVPDCANAWLSRFLRGEVKSPPRKVGADSRDALHTRIVQTVATLADRGVLATRNDAGEVRRSGCDIVAEVLREEGYEPATYDGIKKIWLKKKFRTLRVRRKIGPVKGVGK